MRSACERTRTNCGVHAITGGNGEGWKARYPAKVFVQRPAGEGAGLVFIHGDKQTAYFHQY